MRSPDPFRTPEPISISVRSYRTPDRAIAVLAHAVAERRYSSEDSGAPRVLRLGGTVKGPAILLTATPYVSQGVRDGRAWGLTVAGEIRDRPDGSEVTGTASSPIPKWLPRILAGWLAVASIQVVVVSPTIAIVTVVAIIVIAMSVLWILVARHNQRKALSHTDRFTEFLASILNEHPGDV